MTPHPAILHSQLQSVSQRQPEITMAPTHTQDEAARPLLGDARASGETGTDYETTTTYGGTDAPVAGAVPRDHAQDESQSQAQGTFKRNLGALDAFAIIISIVIGSGIFTSPGSIDTNVPAPGWALVVWLVGGVLAWTGASTMAELGTAIPGEGNAWAPISHPQSWAWLY